MRNKIIKWDEINGETSQQERLEAFLETANDSYAILQLRHIEETIPERFASRLSLERMGKEPVFDHYEIVYLAPLEPFKDQNLMLEEIYTKFNIQRPEDFYGHSLSISDVVALKQKGKISWHYVDSVGFSELPDFMQSENYLKNAEMAMEDDYGMIDGIINNGKSEQEKQKTSVLDRLKEQAVREVPRKTSEHEMERDM